MTHNSLSSIRPESPPLLDEASGATCASAATAEPRLLIVDDIVENRAILARRFKGRGFHVSEATGGHQALQLIEQQAFDLVLLDVMMPDLSGIEVLERIRQLHSADVLPVIMVTARTQSEDVVEALALGANDYVTKPVDFAVALARINTQLARKRASEAARSANAALSQANSELERRVAERTTKLREANERLQTEIAEREQSQAKIEYLAHHDALTGLANRVLFREQLEQAIAYANRCNQAFAVLFIDLDEFKTVNDSLGHSIGDGLLKSIANRLRESLSDADQVARFGGDEFAIIQRADEQPQAAAALASHLIELISRPCLIEGHQVVIGASIGIAVPTVGSMDPELLVQNADVAMYNAKADGRGRFRFFEPDMDAAVRSRRAIQMDLRAALAEEQFELHYQPFLNLQSKQVVGFEALLRWNHPQRGFVPPSEFIPISEEMGLIVPLGEWVLRRACAEAATWPGDLKVAVNLSPVQFKSGKVVEAVADALANSNLPASRLEVEITEAILLERSEQNLATLHELRALGVRVCMDDFGTGYSNLNYLRAFRFDKLKIDQSFIRDLTERDEGLAIIRAIAGLGVSFGLSTTAEGVETEAQLRRVEKEGCTEVQGFIVSPARPADEIHSLLAHLNSDKERDPGLR